MYTDFHDQNYNSLSPSVVMPAVKNHIIRHSGGFELFRPDGQAPFASFEEDDYIRESFVLTNSCGSDGIKLGSVNIGMMKVTVKNENVARIQSPDMLMDCVAYVSFDITVDDNITADVRYGAYFVKEVEQLAEGVKLTCYDGMCKLDAPFSGALSGTPYQILTAAATACGVRVQSTQAEIEALPNGTKTFTLHEDNDCKTWRDVLSYLSALMGCFVTFGRLTYGAMTLPGIEVRPFGGGASSFCDTITDTQRYTGAKFSLWDTAYAEFTLKAYALEDPNDPDSAKKQDFTYTDTTISTEGQTIDLGYNPFLQATTPETGLTQDQIAILHDLLEKVATYQYTPLQITLPVGFIYDLGDVIKCTGRLANTGFAGGSVDDAYGVILNETYTYGRDYRIKSLDSHAGKGRSIGSGPTPPGPTPTHENLPYTTSEILCEATVDNYTSSGQLANEWGIGRKPYQMYGNNAKVVNGSDICIEYDADSAGAQDIDLTDIPELGTVYIVAKILDYVSYISDVCWPIIAFGHHNNEAQIPAWVNVYSVGGNNTTKVDSYSTYDVTSGNNGKDLAKSCIGKLYKVYALSADGNGNISWYAKAYERHEQLADHGKHVTMSYTCTDNSTSMHTQLGIKYFAVVKGAESASVIKNNIEHLTKAFVPYQMLIFTGFNDNKYTISFSDGEFYTIPFETDTGRVSQNVHEYTHNGVLVRIEFAATPTQTNAVTGTIYFNGTNPLTYSANARGYNPSYGVDAIIDLPISM